MDKRQVKRKWVWWKFGEFDVASSGSERDSGAAGAAGDGVRDRHNIFPHVGCFIVRTKGKVDRFWVI